MNVSVEMVKSLVVKICFSHSESSLNNKYEITLTDNRFAEGEISSQKLRSLIEFLDKEKVFFQAPLSSSDFKGKTLTVEQEKSTIPGTILSEIFQDSVSHKIFPSAFAPHSHITETFHFTNQHENEEPVAEVKSKPIKLDYNYDSFLDHALNIKVPDRFLSASNELPEDFVCIESEFVKKLNGLNLSQLFQEAENRASKIREPDLTEQRYCRVLSTSEFSYIEFLKCKIRKNGHSECAFEYLVEVKKLLITFLENVESCNEENKEI